MFVDEALIQVTAGKGGNGSASFRREKFIPRGGPDGGDGGDGGHIYLRVKDNMHGLAGLAATHSFKAEDGDIGRGKNMYGRKGESITIDVPPGTVVYEVDDRRQTLDTKKPDFTAVGGIPLRRDFDAATGAQNDKLVIDTATFASDDTFRIAKGGKGGLGNVHFKSSTHQAPTEFTPGTSGERKALKLVVRHIADVGILGLPNVGKSTLLARVSSAKPKVADYPFTTLEPHLGVVEHNGTRFVMADIPGLIEGAAHGKGLGIAFLKHLTRTKVLLHLIDAQSTDPLKDYETVRAELAAYDLDLTKKPEVIALSRIDTLDEATQTKLLKKLSKKLGHVIPLSSQSGVGVDEILRELSDQVTKNLP